MKHISLVLFFVLVTAQLSISCSWVWIPFCQTASVLENDLIVSGEITGVDADGIDLEIIDVIRGVESRSTVRIWDGTDFDCNGNHSMTADQIGSVGDSVIVILPKIDSIENSWDQIGDYRMPLPYGNSPVLRVKKNRVKGFISLIYNVVDSMRTSLGDFPYEKFVSSWDENMDCSKIVSTIPVGEPTDIRLFPNPSSSTVSVATDVSLGALQLEIYDFAGNLVLEKLFFDGSNNIPIDHLPSGIYITRIIKDRGVIHSQKLVKI